jgi:hypothetical protein
MSAGRSPPYDSPILYGGGQISGFWPGADENPGAVTQSGNSGGNVSRLPGFFQETITFLSK